MPLGCAECRHESGVDETNDETKRDVLVRNR